MILHDDRAAGEAHFLLLAGHWDGQNPVPGFVLNGPPSPFGFCFSDLANPRPDKTGHSTRPGFLPARFISGGGVKLVAGYF